MKLPLAVLSVCALFLAASAGVFVYMSAPKAAPEALVEEVPMVDVTATTSEPVATLPEEPRCTLGVPGPASSPLTDVITPAMKDAAVDAVIAREKLFLNADADCLRAYSLAVAVSPEQKEEIAKQDDKTIRATALMMALIMDLPEEKEVRRLMLKPDAEWKYKEGEVSVSVTIDNPPEEVVGHSDTGEPVYGTSNGWGTTIYYRNGRWY
ncbi:MAG TPA: hypothetical protein VGE48_00245 [Candidatus Paceibacterota bacterium]